MASPTQYDLDLKLAELRINGYVLFEDLIPVEKIDRIREAFLPYLEQVRAHGEPENGVMLHGRSDDRLVFEGRLQMVNRYTLYVPWEQPFADPEIETQYDEILEAGDFPTRRRLNLRKGTLWIQDPRTLHRGTPNRSDHTRPELVICYSLPWFGQRVPIEMTQAEFEKISERGRRLHTTCRVID